MKSSAGYKCRHVPKTKNLVHVVIVSLFLFGLLSLIFYHGIIIP